MTLRDMLNAGITFAGAIRVKLQLDGEFENEIFLSGESDQEIRSIPAEWMDLEVKYFYSRGIYDDVIIPHMVIELEDRWADQ